MSDPIPLSGLDLGPLHCQINDVIQGLKGLTDSIDSRHAQSDRLHCQLQEDLAALRRDQCDLEEKLDCVICVVQHDLEALRSGALARGQTVDELLRVVQELQAPVAEIIALRSRVAGIFLTLGVIGSVAVWLAEPLYRWIIERHYLKQQG